MKNYLTLLSAAVVIGALRVKKESNYLVQTINPFTPGGHFCSYILDESVCQFRVIWSNLVLDFGLCFQKKKILCKKCRSEDTTSGV